MLEAPFTWDESFLEGGDGSSHTIYYAECYVTLWYSQISQTVVFEKAHTKCNLKLSDHIHSDRLQGTHHFLHVHSSSMMQ